MKEAGLAQAVCAASSRAVIPVYQTFYVSLSFHPLSCTSTHLVDLPLTTAVTAFSPVLSFNIALSSYSVFV